jgi:hypothetical protein
MRRDVSETRGVILAVFEADEVASRAIGIEHGIARRVGDLADPACAISGENNALATRMHEAVAIDGQRVANFVFNALQSIVLLNYY